jgi:hypothetical protein
MEVKIGDINATVQGSGDRCVIMCPPHPLMGGSRYDIRLKRIANTLEEIGVSSLRMDYRSEFSGGTGEIEDMREVIEFSKEKWNKIVVLGYSFGAVVASHSNETQILMSPLPEIDDIKLRVDGVEEKYVIFGMKDEFVNVEELEELLKSGRNVKRIVKLETDHFYTGALQELVETVVSFIQEIF